ncbi:tetratricopeptide repeat protein [Bacteroidota bacterium]
MLKYNIKSLTAFFLILVILYYPAYMYSQTGEIPITTSSEEALSFFMEGRYKYENIQYATAAALFDEAILTDPGFAMAYLYRARCGGGFNITQQNLDKACSLKDFISDGEKNLILFQKALAEGDHVLQKDHILILLDSYPEDKRVHYNAGLYYDFIVDPPMALMHYLRAIEIDNNYAAAYNKIGYDFIDLKFFKSAEEAFKKYINLIPNSPNPYDSYAELLLKLGKYQESIVQYQTAYQKDVLFTQALSGIGNNYIFIGEFEKARDYYHRQHEKALRMNEKLDALMLIAISYVHEGNIEEAVRTLELRRSFAENKKLIPDVIDSYNSIGFILTEIGQVDKGKKYFDKAAKVVQESDLPENLNDAYLVENQMNTCYWLTKKNKLKEAENELKKCSDVVQKRENMNETKRLNLIKGIYSLENNDSQAALDYFYSANTESPYTWYYMSKAYKKLGFIDHSGVYKDRIKFWNQNSLEYALVRNK